MFRSTLLRTLRCSLSQTTSQQQPQQLIRGASYIRSFSSSFRSLQQQQQGTSIPDLLPLKFEQNLYATIQIHDRPYLITEGDEVILPFKLKHGEVGDVINFTNVTTVGSKNYTYTVKDSSISPEVLSVKGIVLEKTKKPMYIKEVTKRRNRHTKHTKVKHDITILRISELKLKV